MITRRSAVLGVAAGLAAPSVAHATDRTLYITPEGSGDGESWDRAGNIRDLPAFVTRVGPGGTVALASDLGPYARVENILLRTGGSRRRPVRILSRARDGAAGGAAILEGARPAIFSREAPKGQTAFSLIAGADHLHFSGLAFRNIGNGCFRIAGPVTGLHIERCTFENVYRFVENTVSRNARDASLTDFLIADCEGARIERSFLRLRYQSANGRVLRCRADSEGLEGDPFAVGCALSDQAHDITYEDCHMANFRHSNGDAYWNGDGFSDERGCFAIRYENCSARGCTDGGFDCKSADVTLSDCLAEDNKRNFRIWSARARLDRCTSREPFGRGAGHDTGGPAHLIVTGNAQPYVRLSRFAAEAAGRAPLFRVEAAHTRIDMDDSRILLPRDALRTSVSNDASLDLRIDGLRVSDEAADPPQNGSP